MPLTLIPECIFNAFGRTHPGESVKVASVTFTTQPAPGSCSSPGTTAQAGLRADPQSVLPVLYPGTLQEMWPPSLDNLSSMAQELLHFWHSFPFFRNTFFLLHRLGFFQMLKLLLINTKEINVHLAALQWIKHHWDNNLLGAIGADLQKWGQKTLSGIQDRKEDSNFQCSSAWREKRKFSIAVYSHYRHFWANHLVSDFFAHWLPKVNYDENGMLYMYELV